MPRGWYLAQGLIPLGESSSDDEEGPCELPDGRLVCGPHGLVWCGKCCVDYSFMDDVLGDDSEKEDQDDDSFSSEPQVIHSNVAANSLDFLDRVLTRGTGRAFPTKFVPPSASVTPLELFSGRESRMLVTRCTLPTDAGKFLICTDGACLDNGQQNPKAGWAFWHGFGPADKPLVASNRLEKKGPFGADGNQTSNRAELRAVIAALCFRYWPGEGFHTMVVATDSEYVVEGSTKWAKTWIKNDWVKRGGEAVKNRDLWEALLGQIEQYKDNGMAVKFWRIPREWNTVADTAAKEAAAKEDAADSWREVIGMNI
ncbi:ribonuclease H-like domain-containing protein [Triangularia setosa]|uniref:ribonuclease H n=1 Tax=Triangularia setosa TaxID=2587417 RepID=A0AAN6VY48_9PEZI|nr:ribonuclease H-like domain-containing protein [Podospora setosa]